MPNDEDEVARVARAKQLRAQIDTLVRSNDQGAVPNSEKPKTPIRESAHQFVQRRMQELKGKESADGTSDS